ncbi:unnamed protein product [Moneuplotes crassus]|uniref:Uncharacterized protein n=1 Tax=Euplotes crassus TaxID=5936 RepID=A0AAD1XUH8_EUPCR|nr:unnamed protein product [Moneuplotes crassus]
MNIFCVVLCLWIVINAKICETEEQIAGLPNLNTFLITGSSAGFMFEIFTHPTKDILFFMSQYLHTPTSHVYTGVFVMDYNLNPIHVRGIKTDTADEDYGISSDGAFIYALLQDSGNFMEVNSTDISITNYISVASITYSRYTGIQSVNGNIYIMAKLSGSSHYVLCRWDRVASNMNCFDYGDADRINYTPVTSKKAFISSVIGGGNDLFMFLADFTNPTNYDWVKKIQCSSSCLSKGGKSLINSNQTHIYTANIFSGILLYHTLDISTGNSIGNGLISSGSAKFVYNIIDYKSQIIIAVEYQTPSESVLLFIDPVSVSVVKELKCSNLIIYGSEKFVFNSHDYLALSGRYSSNSKILKSRVKDLTRFSEITEDTSRLSLNVGTYALIDLVTWTPLNLSTPSLSNLDPSTLVVVDHTINSINSDYLTALWDEDFAGSYITNVEANLSFNWACSHSSNIVPISFTLEALDGASVPDWVNLDASNQFLILNKTPIVTSQMVYKFAIRIDDGTDSTIKRFYISVQPCEIKNCATCQSDNPGICTECQPETLLSNDKRSCSGAEAQSEVIIAQAVFIFNCVICLISSIFQKGSSSAIFDLINQYQLYILLPLLMPQYFPPKVRQFILGIDFSLISLDFIPAHKIPVIKAIDGAIKYDQEDYYLSEIGLSSGSTLKNFLPMIFVTFIAFSCHFVIYLIYLCMKNVPEGQKCRVLVKRLFVWMTFSMYIRFIMEEFLYFALSIVSGIINFVNHSSKDSLISSISCLFFAFGIIVFIIIMIISYCSGVRHKESKFHHHYTTKEFYSEIKNDNKAKLNTMCFIFVRLLSVLVLLPITNVSKTDENGETDKIKSIYFVKFGLFIFIHLTYCFYLIIARPSIKPAINLIESVSQVNYVLAIIPLSFLYFESDWSSSKQNIYIYILIIGPALGCVILIIDIVNNLCARRKERKLKIAVKKLREVSEPNLTIQRRSNCKRPVQESAINLRK